MTATRMTVPMTTGTSRALDRVYQQGAEAGDGEDGLRDDGAAHAAGEADAHLGDDRHEAVAQGVCGSAPGRVEAPLERAVRM